MTTNLKPAEGVWVVSELKDEELNGTVLSRLSQLNKELAETEIKQRACETLLLELQPQMQRFEIFSKRSGHDTPLDPALPMLPEAEEEDDEGCPYCGWCLKWEGKLLPVVIAKYSHQYHIPCLSHHLFRRYSRTYCSPSCAHIMSETWLLAFGIRVIPQEPINTKLQKFEIKDFQLLSTPESIMRLQDTTPVHLEFTTLDTSESIPAADSGENPKRNLDSELNLAMSKINTTASHHKEISNASVLEGKINSLRLILHGILQPDKSFAAEHEPQADAGDEVDKETPDPEQDAAYSSSPIPPQPRKTKTLTEILLVLDFNRV